MTSSGAHPDRLRVLLDARMAEWTGVGRYTKGLARALARRDDVELIAVTAEGDPALLPGSPGARAVVAKRHPFTVFGSRELGKIVASTPHDITHCPHFPTPVPAGLAPLVVTLHDVTPLIVPSVMPSYLRRAVYKRMNRRAIRSASAIVADSASAADDIAARFPDAGPKIHVVPLAADDLASGPVGELPASLVPEGARYVFSMGNTKPHKDLPTLLAAWSLMAERYPDTYLLLAGKEDKLYLDAWLSGSARERVKFTGRVDDDVLRALYANAAVFAFPSRYEGFGLPPLEAMSLGAPVVTVNGSSLPEVVGDAALLVPVGDSETMARDIGQLLDDASLADGMRERGRARAAEFSWDLCAEQTVAVYRELLR